MRNISVTIDRMGKATVSEEFLGYGGEHNAVVLTVSFTEDGYQIYSQADYFRVVVDGVYSDELYISQNNISYTVPQEVMVPPKVHCQLIGYKVSLGEIEAIIKSQVFDFSVSASEVPFECVDSQPNVFEKILAECTASAQNAKAYAETARDKSLIAAQSADEASLSVTAASNCAAEASNSAAEALSSKQSAQSGADTALANAVKAANSAERAERAATVLDVNNISNAYKGYQSGSEITLTDVSPLEHELKVKVSGRESKNLFKPDDDFIQYFEGLSVEWYEDGRFRLYGSAVGYPSYSIGEIQLSAGDYSFSRRPSDWIHDCYLYLSYSDNYIVVPEEGCTFTLTEDTTVKIGLNIETHDEFDCVFALQLEEGTEVTEYESPTFGLTSVKVIVKNNNGETVAEYTPNADGTVDGVKSLYPTTVITTDTDGVTIDCEYNKDLNKLRVAHWEKLLDITIDEEVNSIILTSDKMPQCKEFIVRAIFPVSTTGETVSLGAAYCYLNNNIGAFRFTATDINKSVITEQRCHILIADNLIYSTGTEGAYGQAAIVANIKTIVGNRVITDNVTQIIYKLNDSTKSYQIGTQFQVYGKVEK